MAMTGRPLSHRVLAMLRAVAAGRGELTRSCEPDLRIDGLPCCDQVAAHELVHAGLVRACTSDRRGAWVAAELTVLGREALDGPPVLA